MDSLANWLQTRMATRHHRQILLISGNKDQVIDNALRLISAIQTEHRSAQVLSCGELPDVETTSNRRYAEHLGREYHYVFYNAFEGFRINALVALSGTIVSNGLLVLLCPSLDSWHQQQNPDFLNRVSFGFENKITSSHFLASFIDQLQSDDDVLHWREDHIIGNHAFAANSELSLANGTPTAQQQIVIDAVIKVAEGHRKRPLVLRADRGRGKSSALGFAVNHLLNKNKKVVITAPTKKAVQQIYQFAEVTEQQNVNLSFYAIDHLTLHGADADIVIVDEAAALPSNLLKQLVSKFHRIVFSSTTYGYEGTGRGFDIRFLPYLKTVRPDTKALQLTQPIRWYENDHLEHFLWKACHLSPIAEPEEKLQHPPLSSATPSFALLDKAKLASDPIMLNHIFSLLVNAHYQTTPDDLMAMLDAPEQLIFVSQVDNIIKGVILANIEGDIQEGELATEIANGNRRVKGHLLAQQLALITAHPTHLKYRYLRIVRIAVEEQYRKVGIGSELLRQIEHWGKQQQFQFVGSSFGGSPDLLAFWVKNDYHPTHVGFQKDKASGEFSLTMLKAIDKQYEELTQQLTEKTHDIFSYHLPTTLKQMSVNLVYLLLGSFSTDKKLSNDTKKQLKDFSNHQRPLELVGPQLQTLLSLSSIFKNENEANCQLLIQCVLQRISITELCQLYGLTGRKEFISKMRTHVSQLLESLE
ncbi:MAG: tRNA(Met) cytidine acetyltransferase TmcA [Aestuariibacter sp.]